VELGETHIYNHESAKTIVVFEAKNVLWLKVTVAPIPFVQGFECGGEAVELSNDQGNQFCVSDLVIVYLSPRLSKVAACRPTEISNIVSRVFCML
jgi:hypothetical protein